MKKGLLIFLALVVLITAGIIAWKQSLKFDEAEFAQIVKEHIQPDVDAYMEEYGWTEVDVQIDMSDITVVSERKGSRGICYLDGEVGVKLNVKEITQALEAEDYSEELCRQIAATSFGLAHMYTQYHSGYSWLVNECFVDNEGNEYTAMFDYDDVLRLYKNEEPVFEKEMPKEKKPVKVNKDGKYLCSKCGSWVNNVTAKGYCSTCTDIYSNDWYIAIDGNVYVDKAY